MLKKKYRFKYGKGFNSSSSPRSRFSRIKKMKSRRPNPILKRLKRLSILAGALLILIAIIYLLGFSNIFIVEEIKFPQENIENEEINMNLRDKLKNQIGENLFFLKTNELEKTILRSFPDLEKLNISKNYPSKIEVEFTQYPLVANIINESTSIKKNYIINTVGYVVKEDLENTALPYIHIKSDKPINPKNKVIDTAKLAYILGAISHFEEKLGLSINKVLYKPIPREIHLLTERDFYVWLDIQIPYEIQLKKLKKALVKLDIYTENLQYIDLRIAGASGDKIIYKR